MLGDLAVAGMEWLGNANRLVSMINGQEFGSATFAPVPLHCTSVVRKNRYVLTCRPKEDTRYGHTAIVLFIDAIRVRSGGRGCRSFGAPVVYARKIRIISWEIEPCERQYLFPT